MTGVYPFYDAEEEQVEKKVKRGETAYIDPRFEERSYADALLAKIIPLCWHHDPDERIDIFQLVAILRRGVSENKKSQMT